MILLDMNSENYFGLDEMGTSIWQAMQEKESLQAVFSTLLEEYEVDEEVLKIDLFHFVDRLEKSGLITLS